MFFFSTATDTSFGQINNIGLLSDQQNGIIAGMGLSVLGVILLVASSLRPRALAALSAEASKVVAATAVLLFVENPYIHSWHCHRRPERSFFVRNRQFHVCARCTGVITGLLCLPAAIAVAAIPIIWGASGVAVAIDGVTQLIGWRKSNNALRFATGFLFGISLVGVAVALIGKFV